MKDQILNRTSEEEKREGDEEKGIVKVFRSRLWAYIP